MAFCRRVMHNIVIDQARARSQQPRPLGLCDSHDSDPRSGDPAAAIELRPALLAALGTLTPQQRAIVVLRYFDDRSENEVADLLGVSAGTVKSTAPAPAARYVELTEKQSADASRTSVIDSRTGDVWTYQQGPGRPSELLVARHDSPTQAQFAGWPTDPVALRALLLSQAEQQDAEAQKYFQQKLSQRPTRLRQKINATQPRETSDDLVFEQATDTLWNPLVGPQLRSSLYKVLADTPGVTVRTNTTDMNGRPAIEISRVDNPAGETTSTFENPATGAVLESLFVTPATGATGSTGYDLYLSITSSTGLPAKPYRS